MAMKRMGPKPGTEKTVRLSSDLALPLEIATESTAILARKRMGKSWLARLIFEQLFRCGVQVVAIDPKGDWWGVRSSKDGKSPGLPVVILGGEHADVPIEPGAGEFVATFVVEKRVSVLIDLSLFRKHQVATFMAAFLETLYRLKAREEFRTAMTLLVDEADAIAPQNPKGNKTPGEFDNVPRMLGAMEDIVRRGGQRGIGIVSITQRTAVLNKNVLTQTSILVLLGMTGKQDVEAIKDWISLHGQPDQAKQVLDSIASLRRGEAWVWAPGWPDEDGTFRRIDVGAITTFDSGATPKVGEVKAKPTTVATVDLAAFEKGMAATIEKAKAQDPKLLKKRITELEAEVRKKESAAPRVDRSTIEAEVQKATAPFHQRVQDLEESIREAIANLPAIREGLDAVARILEGAARVRAFRPKTSAAPTIAVETTKGSGPVDLPPPKTKRLPEPLKTQEEEDALRELGSGHVAVLTALSKFAALGVSDPSRAHVAGLAGYAVGGGSFKTYVSRLSTLGFIEYVGKNGLKLTALGMKAVPHEAPPTLAEYQDKWLSLLPGEPHRQMLRYIIGRYPEPVSREELGTATGYSIGGGSFKTYLSRLSSLGLVSYKNGPIEATGLLFPEGLR